MPSARNRSPRQSRGILSYLLDRLLSLLSWTPSNAVGVPLAVCLAALPVLYIIFGSGGVTSVVRSVTEKRIEKPSAAQAARETEEKVPKEEDPFGEIFTQMTAELEQTATQYPGQVGFYLKDLDRGWEWGHRPDDLFPSASLIKVPVMAGVFERIHQGRLTLSSRLSLRRRTRMGGSGTIKWRRDGTRFTVRRLLDKMIHESDNTAMRILLDEIGMGFLQHELPKMGLVYTEIYPEGLTLHSGRVRYENYTTAREMGMIFEKIYRGEMVDRFASELMLEILKGKRRKRTRLAKGLPVGWDIAHKTGLLRRACHDAGIIFTPYGDYVLVVLTGRNRSYHSAKTFITKTGRITYRHYKSQTSLYARAAKGGKGGSK